MQELISKEDLKKIFDNHLIRLSAHFGTYKELIKVRDDINSLPTTVHHEYKDGKKYEFSYDGHEWHKGIFAGYQANYGTEAIRYSYIRPLQSEHPDIIQARELASKHGYTLTKL